MTDGREIPVDCAFAGYDPEGIAVWKVITKIGPGTVELLKADTIPPRTAIQFPLKIVDVEEDS